MAKPMERMDEDHEKMVTDCVEKLMEFLDESLPRSKIYSHVNMSINVLTGALVTIAHNFVHERDEGRFIENMALTLKANFDVNRENKKKNQVK